MNARDYKLFRFNNYYHIFNRGNNKQPIFLDEQDYLVFLNRFKLALGLAKVPPKSRIRVKAFPLNSFAIICYCLMPNHFHFLIRQNTNINIDRLMAKVCTSYAKYFNLKYNHIGNVFQDRFKSKIIEGDSYFTYLSSYIHNNPVNPLEYNFSSFKDYCRLREEGLCDKTFLLGLFEDNSEKYKQFVLGFSENNRESIKELLFED
jgi:REP element-mobilizing transposase RayT